MAAHSLTGFHFSSRVTVEMWPAAALLCLHHGMNQGTKSGDILYFLFKCHAKTNNPELDVVHGASLLP